MQKGQGVVSRGFDHKRVRIETLDRAKGIAWCRDDFGRQVEVRIDVLRAKGGAPAVGEFWYIDRQYGGWTLALCLGSVKPVVSGVRGSPEHLVSLTAALAALGLVEDLTTPP